MGGPAAFAEALALTPPPDFRARVVYLPVRHHSPACAEQVERVIRELRPDAVLVEGPRDATALIPLLLHPETRLPVALYTTCVRRGPGDSVARHAAYSPFCDSSPELAALRAAAAVGARARFIDLTFPELVRTEDGPPSAAPRSLQQEPAPRGNRFVEAACRLTGARDYDDLWDHLFETGSDSRTAAEFFHAVLAFCALSRQECPPAALAAAGCLARESAMAAEVAEETGRVIVVTGGIHSVALPGTLPRRPAPCDIGAADTLLCLVRYGFEQLDRLNGYASGLPAPEYYQRRRDGRDPDELIVEVGRRCREGGLGTSSADAVAALAQARRLAALRGHVRPSREDLMDGIRSAFVKGEAEVEGVRVLAEARRVFTGTRIGTVPAAAGLPPLVEDFRRTAERLRLDVNRLEPRETTLDLYRRGSHRETSRFFHRLRFLNIPFGRCVRGPDFVAGTDLERMREVWAWRWTPDVESALVERSPYGASLAEAAGARLWEQAAELDQRGEGGRAGVAATLLLESCRLGVQRGNAPLLGRLRQALMADESFPSLMAALDCLLVLRGSREPLEAHDLDGLEDVAAIAYDRACFVLPRLTATPDAEADRTLDALRALPHAALALGDTEVRRELRGVRLGELAAAAAGSATLIGAGVGALFAEGRLTGSELAARLAARVAGWSSGAGDGAGYLRGLLAMARQVLWQVEEVIPALHRALADLPEDEFVRLLPPLRRCFAGLTPRETDRVAAGVGAVAGRSDWRRPVAQDVQAADLVQGSAVDAKLRAALEQDGLEAWRE